MVEGREVMIILQPLSAEGSTTTATVLVAFLSQSEVRSSTSVIERVCFICAALQP